MENAFIILFGSLLFVTLYFQVFLFVTYLENKKIFSKKEGQPDYAYVPFPAPLPSVTIIVPCWNEAKTIGKTILSLLALEYPKEKLRIFVVDDGSDDETAEAIAPFLQNPSVRYFHKENGGKHTALNLGIAEADTDFVGCLDADSFVAPDALLRIVPLFENQRVMAVTPSIKVHSPETVIQRIQDTEYTLSIIFRKLLASINAQYVAPGPFSIYRRSVFNTIGVFKQAHNTEDMEIALRIHAHGFAIENAFGAEVYTVAPETLRDILKQRIRWTYGFMRNVFDYRRLLFKKQYGNLGMFSLPIAFLSIGAVLFFTSYILKNIAAYVYQKVVSVSTIGISSSLGNSHFSWFFFDTTMTTLVIYMSFVLFAVMFFISVYHARDRVLLSRGDAYFVLLYGLIAPLWMARAVVKLASWRPIKWR